MMFILRFWQPILGAVVTAVIGYWLHSMDTARIELKHTQDLANQEAYLNGMCEAQKAITNEVSNAYQNRLSAVNRELAALKRVRPSTCIVPATPNTACRCDAATGRAEHVEANGVTSDAFLDYAADAERYRIQLIGCQDFITRTWELTRPNGG